MKEKAREMGIEVMDAVPWGTHICQFYKTKQDLLDILVPYFKAGLENNEFCIWVTSQPLIEKGVEEAMRKAVPKFAQYLGRGQIEVIPYDEWYLKEGVFNREEVYKAWIDKLNHALAEGYDGMRVTGNMTWLDEKIWGDFTDYEEDINNGIVNRQMIAICTYSLDRCGASEIVDIVGNHPLALIKRAGNWVLSKPGEGQKMTQQATSRRRLTSLQERFNLTGFGDFIDQEIVELLIGLALPYRESRKVTEKCLVEFKDLNGFLAASPEDLERVGITSSCMFFIKLLHELPAEILRKKIVEQPFYQSSKEVFDYLYYSMRDLKKEVLKAVYLNSRNEIIEAVKLFEGSLQDIPIRPREIVASAITCGAASVIFVHNHPSADPTPSKSDRRFTRDLVFIGEIVQIKVLDHIIIGGNRYFSFADEGLINKYQLDLLNLRIRRLSDSRELS